MLLTDSHNLIMPFVTYCYFLSLLITAAQPKAGTGYKMQSISVVFSTLHCEGYIADLRYRRPITSGSARWLIEIFYPPF